MLRSLPRIGRDRRGVTIVEFALVVPVLLAVVMGGFELAYQGYVNAVVRGELMKAGRNNALERAGSDEERFIIDQSIREAILRVAPSARVAPPQRVAFSSYARVRSPAEPDGNNNGICEPGETYEDSNRNGRWDDNSGVANGSGAKDVIVYTVNVEYDRLFPVAALVGMSNTVEISASTNLRIQPYDMQGAGAGPALFVMRAGLIRDNRALAFVEFALSLPVLLILLLGGVELTNQILVQKQLSQIAMMVADNASRMGDDAVLGAKPVNEREINDLLLGAEIEAGELDIARNGRIILSSIERNEDGGQWVHWQRCFGLKPDFQPAYEEGEGSSGTDFEGLGSGTTALLASEGDAIMFVELAYDYEPIVPIHFAVGGVTEFRSTAAMNVRDRRDLSGVQSYPGATPSTC